LSEKALRDPASDVPERKWPKSEKVVLDPRSNRKRSQQSRQPKSQRWQSKPLSSAGLNLATLEADMNQTPGAEQESSLRILLVEDDSDQAAFTQTMLQAVWATCVRLDHTTSVQGAIDRLSDYSYDVALLDLGLPDAQELEALNSLVGAAPELPLVI